METSTLNYSKLIGDVYQSMNVSVIGYLYHRTNDLELAKDLAQETFLRLLECGLMVRKETVRNMLFTIARNLLFDFLRRQYKKWEMEDSLVRDTDLYTDDTESRVIVRELSKLEKMKLRQMPKQRRKVYSMNRFRYKNAQDISMMLNLSRRTVENHLLLARKEMREYIQQCI